MRVIVDACGGDNAPLEILLGTAQAVSEYGIEAVLCGKEQELRQLAAKKRIDLTGNITFAEAEGGMPPDAEATDLLKKYPDCSMAVGLKLLAEGRGDAFVSAGNSGGLVVGATFLVKRIKGVKRPAFASVLPSITGCYMLLDSGANLECRPEMLLQFGIMGAAYMQKVVGVERPRVGLLNVGTEENKGLELQLEAFALLQQSPLHFLGNIEARTVPMGECEVAVCDGFVGNMLLKLAEGVGEQLAYELKKLFLQSGLKGKLAGGLLQENLTGLRKHIDYTEYGGAPLMGIAKPVIKAHGSSNAKAFKNAIRQAASMHDTKVIDQIASEVAAMKASGVL